MTTSMASRVLVATAIALTSAVLTSGTALAKKPTPPPPEPPPPPPPAGDLSFQGLGVLPGALASYGLAVSGDGSGVVGYNTWLGGATRAFRWTAAAGMTDLGTLGGDTSSASAASFDGAVVVGESSNASNLRRPFRWTAAGGMSDIGTVPPEWLQGYATDVSGSGTSIVGLLGTAERWSSSAGFEDLGDFTARGISADGQVVVGHRSSGGGVRWTPTGGLQDLGTFGGGSLGGAAGISEATSEDGSVVVGQARDTSEFWKAFRWTQASGLQDLGTLGGPIAAAFDVSSDGSVVVGKSLTSSISTSERAFRWTTTMQLQDLQQALQAADVSAVSNWKLQAATGVSADGTVIVGWGRNPSGQQEAFRAVLALR
jgi:probable HAF family extracellular repeat protein